MRAKIFIAAMGMALLGGIAIDEWYRQAIQPVYAFKEEVKEVPIEPRPVKIIINYSGWDKKRIQEEIIKELPIVFLKIAECESGTRQYYKGTDIPVEGRVTPADTGIFQINKDYHLRASKRLGMDLDSPIGNIAYTKHLYASEGLAPWSASKGCWGK